MNPPRAGNKNENNDDESGAKIVYGSAAVLLEMPGRPVSPWGTFTENRHTATTAERSATRHARRTRGFEW
jgi:hypothetical protein